MVSLESGLRKRATTFFGHSRPIFWPRLNHPYWTGQSAVRISVCKLFCWISFALFGQANFTEDRRLKCLQVTSTNAPRVCVNHPRLSALARKKAFQFELLLLVHRPCLFWQAWRCRPYLSTGSLWSSSRLPEFLFVYQLSRVRHDLFGSVFLLVFHY